MPLTSQFRCSGEAAAHNAGEGDHCKCADCQQFFPGGQLWCFPHGNICDDCKQQRQDAGLQSEAFGVSPRQATDSTTIRTAALPVIPSRNREDQPELRQEPSQCAHLPKPEKTMSKSFHSHQSRQFHRDHERVASGLAVHPGARPVTTAPTQGFSSPLARDLFAMCAETMQAQAAEAGAFVVPPAVPLSGIISPKPVGAASL